MEVEDSPALPPHLCADHHNALDQLSSPSEEPSNKASDRPKKTLFPLIKGMMLDRGLPQIIVTICSIHGSSTNIILFIPMHDIFFCKCLMRNVLLSTILFQ